MGNCIIWFRNDLRLQNNLTIKNAIDRNSLVLPIYILDSSKLGAASKTWLFKSLSALDKKLNGQLRVYDGSVADVVQ